MNHLTHPFRSDEITFTKQDLMDMMDGKELSGCGAVFKMEKERKPDLIYYGVFDATDSVILDAVFTKINDSGDHIKVTFDGETGKLKSAEVL